MEMVNESAYLTGPMKIELRPSKMPVTGELDLMIEVKHVGICGSDIQVFARPETCMHPPVYPVVLGHECAGVVVEVGSAVKGFHVGDRVAVEPGVPCMHCKDCLEGRYNLCRDMDFMACYPWNRSALNRYIVHPAIMCFKLPDNVSMLEGAMMEPLSVGLQAADRAGAKLGDRVAVLGMGCIGLMTQCALLARGVTELTAVDLFENRLQKAAELGASYALNSASIDVEAFVMKLTEGRGLDLVFETAGNPVTFQLAQKLVRPGGKLVLVGNIAQPTSVRFMEFSEREIDIISVFRYRNKFPMAISAVSSGRIPVRSIATDVFAFQQTQEAFEHALHEKQSVLKAIVAL